MMIGRFLLGLVLASTSCATLAGDRNAGNVTFVSMTFEAHGEAPARICEQPCRMWVTGAGPITERTPQDFKLFADKHNLRGATLVLDSEGGSVVGAIELGRAVRGLEMTTTVGKAIQTRQADGTIATTFTPRASCQSMCVFLMLAGRQRYVAPEARLLVHQIWLTDKTKGSKTHSYTADELALVERDIGKLVRYTIEMGGDAELIEAALQVPPWEALRRLSSDEIQRMKLSTADDFFTGRGAALAQTPLPAPVASSSQLSGKAQ